ncbi:MAG: lysostaphin resistance A-like protein [Haloferacaceae archaeon]
MTPLALVWNGTERRLRAPVRVVLAALVALLLTVGLGLALSTVAPLPAARVGGVLVSSTVTAVAVGLTCLVAAYALDRRRLRDYGLSPDPDWVVDLVAGVVLGLLLMAGITVVSLAAGLATVEGTFRAAGRLSFPAAFLVVTLAFVAVSVGEELALRGYLLTNLAEGLRGFGERPALALATLGSAAVFGALHATNPNATAVSVLGVGLGGVMLGLGYVLTGRLALPVGLHFSWNLAQGPIFGFPVSGLDLGVSVLVLDVSGPAQVTGGAFGPEAGLLGAAAIVVGTALIVGYARTRGRADRSAVVVPDLRWWSWDARDGAPDPRLAGVDDAPGSEPSRARSEE